MIAFREAIQEYAEEPLTRQVLMNLLKDYKRPNDKINELVKKGELTQLKKGFYIPGPKLNTPRPGSFLIANHLWGPSYISLETALSYWAFIPERVFEVSSIALKRTKTYITPIGRFSYFHTPLPYYSFGIQSISFTQKQTILIASPEKAICDKIVMTSGVFLLSTKQVLEFLIDDMRMEEDMLRRLKIQEMNSWLEAAPKKTSLELLVKTLKDL